MNSRFLGQQLAEKHAMHRQMAAEARRCAATSETQELKDGFNSVALIWESLAVEYQTQPAKNTKDPLSVTQKLPVF